VTARPPQVAPRTTGGLTPAHVPSFPTSVSMGTVYILVGIRGGYTRSGYTKLVDTPLLANTIERIAKPDEVVFPSLSWATHDYGGVRPKIGAVVFVDLALPGGDLPFEIQSVKTHLPSSMFVLYASGADFQRCMSELPQEWTIKLQKYFLLPKPNEEDQASTEFEGAVRRILDEAKKATLARAASSAPGLPHGELQVIHAAAVSVSLHENRTALLGGIDPSVVSALPVMPDPSSQMLSDLQILNRTTLLDGLCPLAVWLSAAITLRRSNGESVIFRRALSLLGA